MVSISGPMIAAVLGGYIVGDALAPVRRSVGAALANMQTAVEQDVEESDKQA